MQKMQKYSNICNWKYQAGTYSLMLLAGGLTHIGERRSLILRLSDSAGILNIFLVYCQNFTILIRSYFYY